MKKIIAVIVFASILMTCASTVKKEDVAREYYNLGNAYYTAKDYKKANQFYERAIDLDPTFVKAKYNYVESLLKDNQFTKAASIIENLLSDDKDNTELLSLLGYVYHVQNKEENALAAFDRILSKSPDNAYALYNSGIILWKLGKKDEAQGRFEAALKLNPDDADVLFNLGNLYFEQKVFSKAIEYLSRYLEKKPGDENGLLLFARSESGLMQYAPALEAYDQVLAANQKNKDAWFEKAEILLTKVKDPDKGIVALTQALDSGFNDPQKLKALYESPDLLEKDRVKKILEDKKLLPQTGVSSGTPEPLSGTPIPTQEPALLSPGPTQAPQSGDMSSGTPNPTPLQK
jgi:tetratricopeptide (TPR) repeat protein